MLKFVCFCAAVCSGASTIAAAPPFVPAGAELGVAPGGQSAAWGDVNGDGWPDLLAGGTIFINEQGHRFSVVAAPAGVSGALIADIDNDGLGDLVCFAPVAVYRTLIDSEGAITFESVALPALPATVSLGATVADFNGDGFLDCYVGGYEVWDTQTTYPDLLLMNNGGTTFTLAQTFAEYRARGVASCDLDEDGDDDIYVSNYRLQPNVLWINDGHGQFADESTKRNAIASSGEFGGGHSIGACWGDFDGDGHMDLFAGNFAHVDSRGDQPKSRFLRNLGPTKDWTLDDLHECGVWYQESYASPACGDYDNDGRLDLFFTTVYANASFGKKNYPVLYHNEVAGDAWQFGDATKGSGLEELPPTYQASWADFDRDGDLDLVTAGQLYVNSLAAGMHWLEVRVRGDGRRVNRQGVGAQARIRLPDGRVLTREVQIGTGQGNADSLVLHFGLGDVAGPVQVDISWPGGATQIIADVAVDQVLEVSYQDQPNAGASSEDR